MSQTIATETRKWQLDNGFLSNGTNVIAQVPDEVSIQEKKILEHSGELYDEVMYFINQVESGTLKPKTAVTRLKLITNKIPDGN